MHLIREWFRRSFNDPQVVGLAMVLILGFGVVIFLGDMLAPVFASIIIAYLLEGLVGKLESFSCPRVIAVTIVFAAFFALALVIVFGIAPMLTSEASILLQRDLPQVVGQAQQDFIQLVRSIIQRFPGLFSDIPAGDLAAPIEVPGTAGQVAMPIAEFEQVVKLRVDQISELLRGEIKVWGQKLLELSLDSIFGLVTIGVYMVLVPVMVFFFLKDKNKMIGWFQSFLPENRSLATRVWRDVDAKIGNYIRGKFTEVFIVWAATYIAFSFLDVKFSLLLAFLVGISVLVPYVGAVAVTVPVTLVAYLQAGDSSGFYSVMLAYIIIQVIDGNIIVPLLFSEVVNLHPVAIIVSILIFGGVWGFWGVFFAIPLATLVQAVIQVWPRRERELPNDTAVDAPEASQAESA